MKTAEYCTQHAPDGMVNVKGKMCRTEGCGKLAGFGVAGTKTAEYYIQHTHDGMVNVKKITCRTEGCDKWAAFGVEGMKTVEYCRQQALSGMVNVKKKKEKRHNRVHPGHFATQQVLLFIQLE